MHPYQCGYSELVNILNKENTALTSVSPAEILKMAQRVRLANIVYRIVREQRNFVDHWQNVFRPTIDKNRDQAIRKMFLSLKINELFQKARIPIIHLKGLPLSQKLYGDPLARHSCDIDLFVPPQYLSQADELLLENGIIRQKYTSLPDINVLKDHRLTKDVPYLCKKFNVKIELHWRLFRWKNKFNKSFDYYWHNKDAISINNNVFHTLSPIDEYLYLGVHGANHGFECLHWLYDFVCYSSLLNHNDLEKIEEKVADFHIWKQYQIAMYCGEKIFPNIFNLKYKINSTPNRFIKNNLIYLLCHSERQHRFKRRVLYALANYFAFI